ncbi:hypothetical protein L6452_44702 [Arctium lappa]|uniref:Uncharacterized protein n=1 Tax=Arctium lappa TaxID=4217 RepID=A0ACB8XGU8_ARCLA|nr:hypothetical protein L6452_44702 [Arctium lappa]
MERNEACGLRAFGGGFDIGLGINFGGVQDNNNNYKTKKPVDPSSATHVVDRDLVAAARFDFLKKKRMPRFRRGASAALRSFRPFTTPLSSTIVDQGRLTFLFSKKLQKSDVGVLKRIVLPKVSEASGGEFAEEHELQLGDYIMLYRDSVNLNYVIQAVKAYEVEEYAKKEVKANLGSQGKAQANNGVLMNQNWPWGGLEVEVLNPTNYPMNGSSVEDQMGMTFIYDTSYSNDTMTPLDFLGGFMTSYPTAQPNFAIENLSIDDLYKI